jgi:hypothetical protein
MGQRFVGQELDHHVVARAGDQAFRIHVQDALQSELRAMQRQLEDAGDIMHADRRDVARGRKHHLHRFQGFVG